MFVLVTLYGYFIVRSLINLITRPTAKTMKNIHFKQTYRFARFCLFVYFSFIAWFLTTSVFKKKDTNFEPKQKGDSKIMH